MLDGGKRFRLVALMRTISFLAAGSLALVAASTVLAIDDYKTGPLAEVKPDVPHGTVTKMDLLNMLLVLQKRYCHIPQKYP